MSAMFSAEEMKQMSSDSIINEYDFRRSRFLDYTLRKNRGGRWSVGSFSSRALTSARSDQELEVYSNTFLELLLFCSTMVLWMSGTVMFAFGFYLVFSQYGWAVLTGSTMYWLGMILQTISALSILTAAGFTTTLLSPDSETPKRALVALGFVIMSAFLLISEVIVCSLAKVNQELKSENVYSSILNSSVHNTLSQQELTMARKKGYECKNWKNQQCDKLYIKMTETYIHFLIGSACLTLALTIIVGPILFLAYRTTVHRITRVQPTIEYSIQSTQENNNQSMQENNNQSMQENNQ